MGAPHILSQHAAPSAVPRNRRGVMTTEWSATSTCGRGSVLAAEEAPGPNAGSPLPAVMRRTEATAGSRAGAWTRWYPSREAHLRLRCRTSRTTLGEGLPQRFRDTNDRPAHADKVCGAPIFSPATTVHRGPAAGIPPRPRAGEEPMAARRRAASPADQCISSSVKRKYEKKWLIARIWSRRP